MDLKLKMSKKLDLSKITCYQEGGFYFYTIDGIEEIEGILS